MMNKPPLTRSELSSIAMYLHCYTLVIGDMRKTAKKKPPSAKNEARIATLDEWLTECQQLARRVTELMTEMIGEDQTNQTINLPLES